MNHGEKNLQSSKHSIARSMIFFKSHEYTRKNLFAQENTKMEIAFHATWF